MAIPLDPCRKCFYDERFLNTRLTSVWSVELGSGISVSTPRGMRYVLGEYRLNNP